MQLADIRTRVFERAGIARSDSALNNDINDALAELSRRRSWPWLDRLAEIDLSVETGTLSSGSYGDGSAADPAAHNDLGAWALPADFRQVSSLTIGGEPVVGFHPADLDVSGVTHGFYVDLAENVLVIASPDRTKVAAFRYDANENVLTNDSDEPKLPDAHIDVLVNLCCANILEGRNKEEDARSQGYRRRYTRGVKDMARTVDPSSGSPRHHRVTAGAPF